MSVGVHKNKQTCKKLSDSHSLLLQNRKRKEKKKNQLLKKILKMHSKNKVFFHKES